MQESGVGSQGRKSLENGRAKDTNKNGGNGGTEVWGGGGMQMKKAKGKKQKAKVGRMASPSFIKNRLGGSRKWGKWGYRGLGRWGGRCGGGRGRLGR